MMIEIEHACAINAREMVRRLGGDPGMQDCAEGKGRLEERVLDWFRERALG